MYHSMKYILCIWISFNWMYINIQNKPKKILFTSKKKKHPNFLDSKSFFLNYSFKVRWKTKLISNKRIAVGNIFLNFWKNLKKENLLKKIQTMLSEKHLCRKLDYF